MQQSRLVCCFFNKLLQNVASGCSLSHFNVFQWWENAPLNKYRKDYLSHVMRNPVFAICEQQRRKSACASAQSDLCLCSLLPG